MEKSYPYSIKMVQAFLGITVLCAFDCFFVWLIINPPNEPMRFRAGYISPETFYVLCWISLISFSYISFVGIKKFFVCLCHKNEIVITISESSVTFPLLVSKRKQSVPYTSIQRIEVGENEKAVRILKVYWPGGTALITEKWLLDKNAFTELLETLIDRTHLKIEPWYRPFF